MTTAPVAANDNVRQFYVYQHRRNDTGEVFYVGKGWGKRAWSMSGRNRHWTNIVNKHGYSVEFVCDGIDEEFAFLLESELIAKTGRKDLKSGPLVNLTDGGGGASGYVFSEDGREKLSAWQRGKKHSPETLAKISASNRNRSPEAEAERIAKIRAAKLGKKLSSEHRAKIAAANTGRTHTAEARAAIGAGHLGMTHSAETKEKIRAVKLGKSLTPEHAQKKIAAQRMCGPKVGSRSGYKGAFPSKCGSRWFSQIKTDRRTHLGTFQTPEEAARAYDAAAIAAWGAGNCYLNFPAEQVQAV